MTEKKENMKDAYGKMKAPTHNIPSAAIFALGAAMADGAKKYQPFNWREANVTASIFFDADQRHIWDWWEGEDYAPDSLVHHLGHQMACCAILLDAIQQGNFVDDRPHVRRLGASRQTVWKADANTQTPIAAETKSLIGEPTLPPLGIPKDRWDKMRNEYGRTDSKVREDDPESKYSSSVGGLPGGVVGT